MGQTIRKTRSKRQGGFVTDKRNCYCQLDVESFQDLNVVFYSFWKENLFCDLDVMGRNGDPIKVHKMILLNLGLKFDRVHLSNNDSVLKDKMLPLDLPRNVVQALVDFAYRGNCEINGDNVEALMRVGKDCDIRGLLKVGHDYVVNKLTYTNAIITWRLSKDFFCPHLQEHVKQFILQNLSRIKDLKGCPKSDLENFLQDHFFRMHELSKAQ